MSALCIATGALGAPTPGVSSPDDTSARDTPFQKVARPITTNIEYQSALRDERREYSDRVNVERMVGGAAALGVGLYGFYQGPQDQVSAKFVFAATQTGGVLSLTSGLVGLWSRSPTLMMDKAFSRDGSMSYSQYQRLFVRSRDEERLARVRGMTVASGALAALYALNGLQAGKSRAATRDTFYVLAVASGVVCGVSAYRWARFDTSVLWPFASHPSGHMSLGLNGLNSFGVAWEY